MSTTEAAASGPAHDPAPESDPGIRGAGEDSHPGHAAQSAGHGGHGDEAAEALGPVDVGAWLAATAGGAIGLLVAAALAVARG